MASRRLIRRRAVRYFFQWVGVCPLIVVEIGGVLALIYGRIGGDFGVTKLFWSERSRDQICAGASAALLLGELCFAGYLLAPSQGEILDHLVLLVRPLWRARGVDAEELRRRLEQSLALRFGTFFGLTVLPLLVLAALPAWFDIVPNDSLGARARWPWLIGLLIGLATLAALTVTGCSFITAMRQTKVVESVVFTLIELGQPRAQLRAVLAAELPPVPTEVGPVRSLWKRERKRRKRAVKRQSRQLFRQEVKAREDYRLRENHALVFLFVVSFSALFGVLALTPSIARIPPAVALCVLIGLATAIYTFVAYRNPVMQVPAFLLLTCFALFVNGFTASDLEHPEFKLRFPGLDAYYERPVLLHSKEYLEQTALDDLHARRQEIAERGLADRPEYALELQKIDERLQKIDGGSPGVALIPNEVALEQWRLGNAHDRAAPKLVIVTASGGGSRSAVWTAVVLKELELAFGSRGFSRHVRVVTGASGGMLGASFYVATLDGPNTGGPVCRTPEQLDRIVEGVGRDSLAPVARQLILRDIPSALCPWSLRRDRGVVLEESWSENTKDYDDPANTDPSASRLNWPLRRLAAGEAAGWRPSVIFSPMLAEDGRRLLISNLDLHPLTRTRGFMILDPDRDFESKMDWLKDLGPLPTVSDPDCYSISAVEFQRIFPKAAGFQLRTAIRMNAAFPIITPAVCLPTDPPRRVLDSAFYDNDGVNLAARWLAENRDWVLKNTSGVVLIQIRDQVSEDVRRELRLVDALHPSAQAVAVNNAWRVGRAISLGTDWLTTPLWGMNQARLSISSFQNDAQVEHLSHFFENGRLQDGTLVAGKPERPEFFTTVVFEGPAKISMSWSLTDREKALIKRGMARGTENHRKLVKLLEWWDRRE